MANEPQLHIFGEVLFDHEIVSLTRAAVRSSVRETIKDAARQEINYQRGRID